MGGGPSWLPTCCPSSRILSELRVGIFLPSDLVHLGSFPELTAPTSGGDGNVSKSTAQAQAKTDRLLQTQWRQAERSGGPEGQKPLGSSECAIKRPSGWATDRTHRKSSELRAPSSELRAPVGCRAQEASGDVRTTTGTRHEDTPTHKHARNKDRPEPHACSVEAQSAHAHPPGRKEAAQSDQERRLRRRGSPLAQTALPC